MKPARLGLLALVLTGLASSACTSDIPLDQLKARWAPPPSRFITVDGMDVHVREEGAGPPLVLLHGTGASLHTWEPWVRTLSGSFRIIRLDLPAFGLTGPHPAHDYSLDAYASLVAHVMDALGVQKAHVAGNSLGGSIAWMLAATQPQRVDRLVLVAPAGYPREGVPLVFRLARLPVLPTLLKRVDPSRIIARSLSEVFVDQALVTPEMVQRYRELALRPGNRDAFVARVGAALVDHSARIKAVTAPTLVLWGEKDAWIPVEHAQRFARDIPGARVVVYPGVGHLPQEEAAAPSAADTLAFLSQRVTPEHGLPPPAAAP